MVDAVEILAAGDPDALAALFTSAPQIDSVKSVRPERVEAETKSGVSLVLHVAPERDYHAALVRTTGSVEHVRDLEAEASARGLEFKGFKLGPPRGGRKKASAKAADTGSLEITSEEDFYRRIGLEPVPPELREGTGEVEAAREGGLPDLISPSAAVT